MNDNMYTIFLVEDDETDVEQIRRTLKKLRVVNPLVRAKDGQEALDMLRGMDERLRGKIVMLLDIGLPGLSGLEVLQEIKNDKDLTKIPVFMLTSSTFKKDIDTAHEAHANGYLVKPVNLEGLIDLLGKLQAFWAIIEIPDVDR